MNEALSLKRIFFYVLYLILFGYLIYSLARGESDILVYLANAAANWTQNHLPLVAPIFEALEDLFEWIKNAKLHVTNTLLFIGFGAFIAYYEFRRYKKITYSFSPETKDELEKNDPHLIDKIDSNIKTELNKIRTFEFPDAIPLRFSEIIKSKGHQKHEDMDSEQLVDFIEDLSPLEPVTSSLLNWVRDESRNRSFRLERHEDPAFTGYTLASGNPDTNCHFSPSREDPTDSEVISDIARRMFFESESQICRDYEAFEIFTQLVVDLEEWFEKQGHPEFAAAHQKVLDEMDEILEKEPTFLTIRVLKAIVMFHDQSRTVALFNKIRQELKTTLRLAVHYRENEKKYRLRLRLPWLFKKDPASNYEDLNRISRQTALYVVGLSLIFLSRIFSQRAHRFGEYDGSPERLETDIRKAEKRTNTGIRMLRAASSRFPVVVTRIIQIRSRYPFIYIAKGMLQHCHDYFDKGEIRNRKQRFLSKPDSVKDLRKADKVYTKGIRVSTPKKNSATKSFYLHSLAILYNNRGYSRLYYNAIVGKTENEPIDSKLYKAELDLYYSALRSSNYFRYPFANLSLLYALQGNFRSAWQAGIAGQTSTIYNYIKTDKQKELEQIFPELEFNGSHPKESAEECRSLIEDCILDLGIRTPTLETIDSGWNYSEGLSEMSYGFIFEYLILTLNGQAAQSPSAEFLKTGLALHGQALHCFLEAESETIAPREAPRSTSDDSSSLELDVDNSLIARVNRYLSLSESSCLSSAIALTKDPLVQGSDSEGSDSLAAKNTLPRLQNIITNLIRAIWHLDDRTLMRDDEARMRLENLHTALHQDCEEIFDASPQSFSDTDHLQNHIQSIIQNWSHRLEKRLASV